MNPDEHLFICGASARAAAFSALRAGLKPWCADLFADADLAAQCPAVTIPRDRYPWGFLDVAQQEAPPGPWMYTGGLENYPEFIHRLSQMRPLRGNDAACIERPRDPRCFRIISRSACVPIPRICATAEGLPTDGSWLLKPRASSGGHGIETWHGETSEVTQQGKPSPPNRPSFFQKRVEGVPHAVVFLSDGQQALLLGVTRQLVGEPWLHAKPFAYSGSIGPLMLPAATDARLQRLGQAIVGYMGLKGIFGVDCVLRHGIPWLIEINPRYPASLEVLEYSQGIATLAWVRELYTRPGWSLPAPIPARHLPEVLGKAILYAREPLVFPVGGPWNETLNCPGGIWELPQFGDIPAAGSALEVGHPILTFFARASSVECCETELRKQAALLDRLLFGR